MSLTRGLGRRWTALLCATALMFASFTGVASAAETKQKQQAAQVNLAKQSTSAVLMDQATGTVLFEKNAHQKLPPASVTKVMTMLLILEAVGNGKVKWSDRIRTSENAASMGGSQIFLEVGEEMTLDEMFKGIALASGNDAAVAVAEHLAGSEENFVQMMNERAAQLGCKNTSFRNVNGLPVENHFTSAHDVALMSRELLKHEEVTKYTGVYQDHLRKSSEKPFWLVNTNKLVRFYNGMDGLKTGYTAEAKYCLSATAKRNGFRVIAVAMGAPTSPVRNAEISQMIDYAFANYKSEVLYKPGQVVQQVRIDKGGVPYLPIITTDTVGVLMKKGEKQTAYRQEIRLNEVKAPIQKGQIVGSVVIKKDEQEIAKADLVAGLDVGKASMWTLFKRTVESWLSFGR
ncbi:D-alanyl-D-alanine carboxypeptidase family protein [Tumebacillus lipolyticus]|uniref:serine-type D-Ala-D-Ala carboxypeptidase n=1 Tax=Tumebacillus lipolyticus TaxID=1280370 RepID=A0ABW4ZSU0_9BACL